MRQTVEQYVNNLFCCAPDTVRNRELREEILQNALARYDDLLAAGETEPAACGAAVAAIGDVSPLIERSAESALSAGPSAEEKRRSGLLASLAAACFILCPMPVIFLDRSSLCETLGPSLLLLLLAAGVGLLIYRANTCPRARAQRRRAPAGARLKLAVVVAMWCLMTALYFVVSFVSGAWYITWILFLIAAALTPLILTLFDLKKEKTDE